MNADPEQSNSNTPRRSVESHSLPAGNQASTRSQPQRTRGDRLSDGLVTIGTLRTPAAGP